MQQAIPYINGLPFPTTRTISTATGSRTTTQSQSPDNDLQKLVRENAVIVFGRHGCCMCHVVKLLLLGLGVNPTISDVDDEEHEAELCKLINGGASGGDDVQPQQLHFPVVFVGGKSFGGLEKVMATHITGELVPILKDAGALWL